MPRATLCETPELSRRHSRTPKAMAAETNLLGPYYWTRWWRGGQTERPRVNHKPNSFTKLSTVRKHVADFIRAYQTYGDRGEVLVTIRDCNGRIVEKCNVRPTPKAVSVYQRDASWNRSGRGGSGGRYHFEGHDCASACGMARLLDLDHPKDAESVPELLRCRANGCRQRWDTASSRGA